MTKVLAISDIHLRGEGFGTPQGEALTKTYKIAEERRPDLIVVGGDVFDTVSTAQQRLVFKRWIDNCLTICPVLIIRGNHDQRGDLEVYDGLMLEGNECFVDESPEIRVIGHKLKTFSIPHCSSAQIAASVDEKGEASELARQHLDNLVEDYANHAAQTTLPCVGVFHGVVSGAALDNGFIPRDNGLHLTTAQLDKLGFPVICGHYHKHQQVGKQAWYVGSPTRNSYGESEGDKGLMLFEHDGERWLEPEFISLNPEPMLLCEAEWVDGGEGFGGWTWYLKEPVLHPEGARVRLRYHVPAEQLEQAEAALHIIKDSLECAKELKVERVIIHTNTARCEQMASTQTVEEGLQVWLQAGGKNPDDYMPLYRSVMEPDEVELTCV